MTIKNDDSSDDTPTVSGDGYRLNEEVCREVLDLLGQNHMTMKTFEANKIEGSITMENPGRVILSVPAEKGWKVKVNGVVTEPERFGNALMAFDLETGDYTISMEYVPEGSSAGRLISLVSILIFALICVLTRTPKKTPKKTMEKTTQNEKKDLPKNA